jgi:hypothetical protein
MLEMKEFFLGFGDQNTEFHLWLRFHLIKSRLINLSYEIAIHQVTLVQTM